MAKKKTKDKRQKKKGQTTNLCLPKNELTSYVWSTPINSRFVLAPIVSGMIFTESWWFCEKDSSAVLLCCGGYAL